MKKTLLFITLLFLAIGNSYGQTPTSSWADNTDIQWYNSQDATFTLSTATELAGFAELVNGGNDFTGKTIFIDADIDLAAHLWTPIGESQTIVFSGTFDGNDHIISNLFVETTENYGGLFGRCIGATLLNITLENTSVKGKDSVGSLVGNAWDGAVIENVHATGVVVDATGDNVGGLVGDLTVGSSMYRCSSEGSVTGNSQVGGLLGSPYDNCSLTECYSLGTVNAQHIAGGLIGASVVGFPGTTATVIDNCYSRASAEVVNGYAGGFCGNFSDLLTVKNSYSTGTAIGPEYAGGFIGGGGNVVTENTYWDVTSSQHTDGVGGWPSGIPGTPDITGKTTIEMKTSAMVDDLNNGSGPWVLNPSVNDGYPSFSASTLSLQTEDLTTVAIYPNVFDTEIQIVTEAELKGYTVYETSGKIIQEGILKGNHDKIGMQSIASGMYMILVNTDQGIISKKILKQ